MVKCIFVIILAMAIFAMDLMAEDICCEYNSPGNPYECCESGNCTWWAWYKRPDLPSWGNAADWFNSAKINYEEWLSERLKSIHKTDNN